MVAGIGMLRAASRLAARPALAPMAFPGASQCAPMAQVRCFAPKAAAPVKPKHEDPTLPGRYATALFAASHTKLDKIAADLDSLRGMLTDSAEFKLFIETPGVGGEDKVKVLESLGSKAGFDAATVNFLKVLIENKRIGMLGKVIESFEAMFRAEKGQVMCKVTSASELSTGHKSKVNAALQKRAGADAKIILEYDVNPAILGGLVVKMGDAVFDYSITTKVERLQTQLLAPVA